MKSAFRRNWLTAGAVFLGAAALAMGAALSSRSLRHSATAAIRSQSAVPAAGWTGELTFLRPGDLVFRRGESVLSAAVMALDSASLYSHAGIVARLWGSLSVVHAVVDEAPDTAGSVRASRLDSFLARDRAAAAAVYRLDEDFAESTAKAELASRIAAGYASRHVPFDRDFDLDTPDAVYCTELIWRAYREAGVELVSGEFPTISFCLKRRKAILPSTLQNSPRLRLIWQGKRID